MTLSDNLARDLLAVWEQITAEISELEARFVGLTPPSRLIRLRELQANVTTITARARNTITTRTTPALAQAHRMGATHAMFSAGGSALAIDPQAVQLLAADTMRDLLQATRHVDTTTKQLVQHLTRDWVRSKMYTGLTAQQAARKLAKDLAENAVHAVTYKNGARVGLGQYADMVIRTKTAITYQAGGFDQGEALRINYYEVMDSPDCGWTHHDDPEIADGKIVTVEQARAYPISHPNCRRVTSPRPDIETAEEAARAGPTPTENAERNRALTEQYWATAEAKKTRAKGRVKGPDMGVMPPAQATHAATVAKAMKRATPPTK